MDVNDRKNPNEPPKSAVFCLTVGLTFKNALLFSQWCRLLFYSAHYTNLDVSKFDGLSGGGPSAFNGISIRMTDVNPRFRSQMSKVA